MICDWVEGCQWIQWSWTWPYSTCLCAYPKCIFRFEIILTLIALKWTWPSSNRFSVSHKLIFRQFSDLNWHWLHLKVKSNQLKGGRMSRAEVAMDSAIFYSLNSSRLGTAAIINNLHSEQVVHHQTEPTKPEQRLKTCCWMFLKTLLKRWNYVEVWLNFLEKEEQGGQSNCPTSSVKKGVTHKAAACPQIFHYNDLAMGWGGNISWT